MVSGPRPNAASARELAFVELTRAEPHLPLHMQAEQQCCVEETAALLVASSLVAAFSLSSESYFDIESNRSVV